MNRPAGGGGIGPHRLEGAYWGSCMVLIGGMPYPPLSRICRRSAPPFLGAASISVPIGSIARRAATGRTKEISQSSPAPQATGQGENTARQPVHSLGDRAGGGDRGDLRDTSSAMGNDSRIQDLGGMMRKVRCDSYG